MAIKSLQVLKVGQPCEEDKNLMAFMQGMGATVKSAFLSYLIKTDTGNILVDTGINPDDVPFFTRGKQNSWPEEYYLPNCLKTAGVSMDDINTVIITHFHLDHIGWLGQFKKAEIVVQKEEYRFATDPPDWAPFKYSAPRFDFSGLKLKLVDGDLVLMPGITLLFTPGHSIGHQSVMVDLPKTGTIILCGDAVFLEESLEKEYIPTCWFDTRQSLLSVKKLKTIAQVRNALVFPGHDEEFWQNKMKKSPEAYF
jgi:glyoxylase-like metal-dependent hydrolase (beta-lactamase superfamily II)